jgi:hypothetical protein
MLVAGPERSVTRRSDQWAVANALGILNPLHGLRVWRAAVVMTTSECGFSTQALTFDANLAYG